MKLKYGKFGGYESALSTVKYSCKCESVSCVNDTGCNASYFGNDCVCSYCNGDCKKTSVAEKMYSRAMFNLK